jgi:hypothetical protein
MVCVSLSSGMFVLFRTLHKLVPSVFFAKLLGPITRGLIILFIIATLMLFQLGVFYYVFFCSSIVHRSWMLLSFNVRVCLFLVYFLVYSLLLVSVLAEIDATKVLVLGLRQSSLVRLGWLMFSGIPPLSIF